MAVLDLGTAETVDMVDTADLQAAQGAGNNPLMLS
jgi:hypothetical protein